MQQYRFYVPDLHCGGCVKRFSSQIDFLSSNEFFCDPLQRLVVFNPKKPISSQALKEKMAKAGFPAYLLIDAKAQHLKERNRFLKRIFVSALGMMQVMMLSIAIYLEKDMPESWRLVFHWFSFFVTTPVMLYVGKPFFLAAVTALVQRTVNMDVPIALAVIVAYVYSFFSMMYSGTELYFDSITMFLFFLTLGRFAQWQASFKTQEASEALWSDIPQEVIRVADADEKILLNSVKPGEHIRVYSGMQFPVDGRVFSGATLVDESMLTGESQPVNRVHGDTVYAGTVNQTQSVVVEVTHVQGNTQLGHIQRLLFEAQERKPDMAQFADQVAGIFVFGVLLLAFVVGCIWFWVDSSKVIPIVVSLLIVTCPCAFSLATPAAIAATLARSTREGLVVANANVFEKAKSINTVVFDKTGTLTTGDFTLAHTHILDQQHSLETVQKLGAALEIQSNHPLARAFHCLNDDKCVADQLEISKEGVQGTIAGTDYMLGAPENLVKRLELELPALVTEVDTALTPLLLLNKTLKKPLALFLLESTVRPNAQRVLGSLRQRLILLSGDHPSTVKALADSLGISQFFARATPSSKKRFMSDLQKEHQVLMVGDGVNDGPVLAQADIGIAMGQGTSLAKASADVVLIHDDLQGLPFFFRMSARCRATIRQNMIWAIGYNCVVVPFAALGFVQPWLAAIGMSLSSLLVVLNSLRILRAESAPSLWG